MTQELMNSLELVIADRRQKAFERFANKNAVFKGCLIKGRKNLGTLNKGAV